jgi:hypothetical protein
MPGYGAVGVAFWILAVRRLLHMSGYASASQPLYLLAATIGIVGVLLLSAAVPFLVMKRRR